MSVDRSPRIIIIQDDLGQSHVSKHEVIVSDDTPNASRRSKPCFHRKYTSAPRSVSLTTYLWGYPFYPERLDPWSSVSGFASYELHQELSSLASQIASDFVPDWDRAVDRLIPRLKNEFSLINTILELDDFRTLFRGFRSLAEAWLRWSFGVRPLTADASALWSMYTRNRGRLIEAFKLLERGLRFHKRIAGRGLRGSFPLKVTLCGREVDAVCDYQLEAKHFLSGYVKGSVWHNHVTYLLDMIGFYPSLGTAWNAIPFSFIIDYFLPIGDALERMSPSWSQMECILDQPTVSTKVFGTYSVRLVGDINYRFQSGSGAWYWVEFSSRNLGSGSFSWYYREIDYQAELDGVDLRGPTLVPTAGQALNIGALLWENTSRFR